MANVSGIPPRRHLSAPDLIRGRSRHPATYLMTAWLWLLAPLLGTNPAMSQESPPSIEETVVMLYYRELSAAAAFYGNTLGLERIYQSDTAQLYRLTPTSVVGIILEGDTAYHQAKADNAVMLSLVTPDVDAWYARVRQSKDVTILKPIANSSHNPIRAFLVEDPGGYTVEFFTWLSPP